MRDQRDEKAAEDFRAGFLQQILGGVDQDHLAGIHFGEEVELGARMREHPLKGLVFENAPEAAQHLLLGVVEFARGKLGLEKLPRRAGEGCDVGRELLLAARLHQFAQGVDGGVRDVQHQPRDIAEDHILLLRHFGGEQRAEHEIIEFKNGIGQPLALEHGIVFQALHADIKQIERDGIFNIARVDDADALMQGFARREAFQLRDGADEIALAVEHDD